MLFAELIPRKALPLPLSRRQYAGKLAFDVDPGLAAEAESDMKRYVSSMSVSLAST